MAFIPAAATMKAEIRQSASGQRVENVLWFRDTEDSVGTTLMEDLAAALQDWWIAELAPYKSDAVVLEEIVITDWSSATAPQVTWIDGINNGDNTSPIMPLNVTVTTTFLTISRGRSGRGRNYFIGLSEGQCSGNTVTGSVVDAIVSGYASLSDYLIAGLSQVEHVVVSFFSENAPRTNGLVQPVVSYKSPDNNVDSQRRRLTGRGL